MIGDVLNTNKRRDVKTREGQVMFNGKKYARDPRTGYYTCTTGRGRKRLHVAIWEAAYGRGVPPGCIIHHLDWDKSHNDVKNLICVTVEEHNTIHNVVGGEAGKALGYCLIATRVNGVPNPRWNKLKKK